MKNILKDNKGINLVSLAIAIIILVIVTTMLAYNAKDTVYIKSLTNLYNDIETLREKIATYYNEYGDIPAKDKYEYTEKINAFKKAGVIGANDDENEFYIIDLQAIENLTLNYGKDYEKINLGIAVPENAQDLYIINKNSHNIFYAKGITIKQDSGNKTYYTDAEPPTNDENIDKNRNVVDKVKVELRYVNGIKIPDKFTYVSGTKETGIIIKDENNVEYTWQVLEEKINAIPEGKNIVFNENQSEEQFLESANAYNGYYLQNNEEEQKVIYFELKDDDWSDVYDEKGIYVDEDENRAYIPKGFRVSTNPTMNKINKGLVIKEESTGNEYVWIKVPSEVARVTATSETDYGNIYNDLKKYCKNYRMQGYEDEWYEGCGLTTEEYNNLKNKMLSSIYKNGGFYIGRYEAGLESPKTTGVATETADTIANTNGVPLSQKDKYPYLLVTCQQAQGLASKVSDGKEDSCTSSLMFGIQWDLVCKFIETAQKINVTSGNENWGNFKNSGFTIYAGKYTTNPEVESSWKNVDTQYIKENGTPILLATGATKRNSILNIYDFAGNEWEWTLEHGTSDNPCIYRGACYSDDSNERQVNTRGAIGTIELMRPEVGFRVALY